MGRLGTGWLGYVIVGLLGHNLDLVVSTTLFASAWCNDGSVTSDVVFAIFLNYMSWTMISLCRRVCDVPVVPQYGSIYYALIAMPVFMA